MALIAATAGGFSQVMIFSGPEIELALVELEPPELAGVVELEELQAAPSTVIAIASVPASAGLLHRNDMGLLLRFTWLIW
jgi:hypothetical protein